MNTETASDFVEAERQRRKLSEMTYEAQYGPGILVGWDRGFRAALISFAVILAAIDLVIYL